MNKEKFEKAVKRICYLSILKDYESNDNADYIYREIVKSAREIVTAAGDYVIKNDLPLALSGYPKAKREFVCTKLSYRDPNATAHTD